MRTSDRGGWNGRAQAVSALGDGWRMDAGDPRRGGPPHCGSRNMRLLRPCLLAGLALLPLAAAVPQAVAPLAPPPGAARPAAEALPPLQSTAAEDQAAFRAGLSGVGQLLAVRRWVEAQQALDALLVAHRGHAEALLHATEVAEDLERAAFGRAWTPPGVETLISGELQGYEPRTGKIKLRYKRDPAQNEELEDMDDMERLLRSLLGLDNQVGGGDFTWYGGAPMHPIHFAGPYTVEIAGFFPELDDDGSFYFIVPQVVLNTADGAWYTVNFGFPRTMTGSSTYWGSASISRRSGGKSEKLDEQEFSPIKRGKKYTLKVVVTDDKLTASCNGKTFLSAKRPAGGYGQFGFRGCPQVQELLVQGEANTAWLEGLVDARQQLALDEFRKGVAEQGLLPDWLASRLAGEPAGFAELLSAFPGRSGAHEALHVIKLKGMQKKGAIAEALEYLADLPAQQCTEEFRQYELALFREQADDAEGALTAVQAARALVPDFVPARVLEARLLHGLGRKAEARAALQPLADGGSLDGALNAELARESLLDEGPARAREVLHAALARGVPPAELKALDAILVRALRGPAWEKSFEFKSRNYHVRSDHSQKLCADAAQELEQSRSLYDRVLGRPEPAADAQRHAVFLFSGLSGYLAYSATLLGSEPQNTAGLYTPVLKQLLIWNLPDRAAMLRTVRHEGFHQYLDRMLPASPTWFNEGTAEYFETARLEGGAQKHGEPLREHVQKLSGKEFKWVPLDELVHMGRTEFHGESSAHYAQSWALVHLLLQGSREDKALYQACFDALLAGDSPRAAADKAFGKADMGKLLARLREHVRALKKAFDEQDRG